MTREATSSCSGRRVRVRSADVVIRAVVKATHRSLTELGGAPGKPPTTKEDPKNKNANHKVDKALA